MKSRVTQQMLMKTGMFTDTGLRAFFFNVLFDINKGWVFFFYIYINRGWVFLKVYTFGIK